MSDEIIHNNNEFESNRDPQMCDRAARLLVHSTACASGAREIGDADEEFLASHLNHCDACRLEAVQLGEVISQLRNWNTRMGGPSRRFRDRLRTRLHNERNATVPKDFATLYREMPFGNSTKANVNVSTGNKVTNVAGAVPRRSSLPAPRFTKSSRRSLLLTMLGLSLALNVFWIVNRFGTREVAAKSQTAAVVAKQSLESRLLRLRNSQGRDGLIDSDPVTTAWWLIAESRAAAQQLSVTTPSKLSIESARNALRQSAQTQSYSSHEAASFVIATGLNDSAIVFTNTEVLTNNGSDSKAPSSDASIQNIRTKHRADSPAFDVSVATRQVAHASPGEPLLANSVGLLNFMSASKANKEKFASIVFSEVSSEFSKTDPNLVKNQSISRLMEMRASSLRAEALCALATASLIAE
ncbi:MAG: hypothetical protein ACKVS6_00310 [Planctomycetota bacterium]